MLISTIELSWDQYFEIFFNNSVVEIKKKRRTACVNVEFRGKSDRNHLFFIEDIFFVVVGVPKWWTKSVKMSILWT